MGNLKKEFLVMHSPFQKNLPAQFNRTICEDIQSLKKVSMREFCIGSIINTFSFKFGKGNYVNTSSGFWQMADEGTEKKTGDQCDEKEGKQRRSVLKCLRGFQKIYDASPK